VQAQVLVLAQEPVRGLALVRESGLALVLVREPGLAQEQQASSALPVRAPGPACWLPAARSQDARHFFRKRNTRQSPE